jgi:hypothetical protein
MFCARAWIGLVHCKIYLIYFFMKKFVLSILMGLLSFMTISFVSPPTPKGGVSDDRCQIDSSVVNANVCVLSDVTSMEVLKMDYRTGCVCDTSSIANIVAKPVFYQSSTGDICNLHIDPGNCNS